MSPYYLLLAFVVLIVLLGSILSKKIVINSSVAIAVPGVAVIWDSLPTVDAKFYCMWSLLLFVGVCACVNAAIHDRELLSCDRNARNNN